MTTPIVLILKPYQLMLSGNVALMRRIGNLKNNIKPKYGAPPDTWEPDIMSCQGEMATALYLNLYWDGSYNDFKARDVGGIVDVRARSQEHYQLILHPNDNDDLPFVLAWCDPPRVQLFGWMFARDGKKQEFWSDPSGKNRPAFFVPKNLLRPMPELRVWAHQELTHRYTQELKAA